MALEISTGQLKHKVVFKQPASSLNDRGEKEKTFSNVLEVFARVDRFNQFRGVEGNDTTLVGALDFYIRYAANRAQINKDWLIEYKGEDYTIHLIEPINQEQMFLRFTAKVITDG